MTGNSAVLEVKSQFCAEFRRFSLEKSAYSNGSADSFEQFYRLLEQLHQLGEQAFLVFYNAGDDDILPINNGDNLAHALNATRGLLRLQVFRKEDYTGYLSDLARPARRSKSKPPPPPTRRITMLDDFRKVSSIIDVDIVPETYRRVKLMRTGARPLGFYIRDGTSIRVTPSGIEKVPAIFISRLLQGGLAETTGLLAVNDEVVEVNGIEVSGKTLDQVTDMMVANSSNLILTTKPVNQSTCLQASRPRASQLSHDSDARSYYSDSGANDIVSHRHVARQSVEGSLRRGVHQHGGSLPGRQPEDDNLTL